MPPFDTIYSINHFIIFNQVVFPLYLSPLFSFKLFFRGNLAEISQISIFYQRRHLCTYHGNIYKLICEISVFSWVEVFPFNSGSNGKWQGLQYPSSSLILRKIQTKLELKVLWLRERKRS